MGSNDRQPSKRGSGKPRGQGEKGRYSGGGPPRATGSRSGGPARSGKGSGSRRRSEGSARRETDRRGGQSSSGDRRSRGAGNGRKRDGSDPRAGREPRGEFVFKGHELPKWVKEELRRTAKRGAGDAAIMALTKAAAHMAAARHSQALSEARNAKRHAPQSPTVMETVGLAAYRTEHWEEALRELRAFRRRTGEGTHLAIEMDVLRALGRDADVEKTFALVRGAEMDAAARSEAKVVYASYLLDHGRPREAWSIAKPGKMTDSPSEAALRQWYVAARAAAAAGDSETAAKISRRIRKHDTAFPGLGMLEEEIAATAES